ITWLAFEELTTWMDLRIYTKMFSLVRNPTPGIPMRVRATTNPDGPAHGAVKRRFRLPVQKGKMVGPLIKVQGEKPRVAIHSRLQENLTLMHADPSYVDNLKTAANGDPVLLKSWIEGSWDINSGGMFDDVWDSLHHIVPEFKVPNSWLIDRSFDWGSSAPFSVNWWAESDGTSYFDADGNEHRTVRGDLFLIKEWYGFDGNEDNPKGLHMLAVDIAEGIIRREIDWELYGKVKPGPADSAIYTVENGVSIAADMGRRIKIDGVLHKGVRWTRADKRPGSRKTGWEMMRKMFRQSLPNQDGTPREHPGVFVMDCCPQFIRTVPSAARDERNPDDIDTHSEDHICFTADTLVHTRKGPVPISELPAGEVLTPRGWLHSEGGFKTKGDAKVLSVITNSTTIRCTPDHIFVLSTGELVEAKELQAGQELQNALGPTSRVVRIEDRGETQDVYCLTAGDAGFFALADGTVVKNCDSARYRIRQCGKGIRTGKATGMW
ncbi:MAG: hypothetical protein F6K62_14560, partial [Sphaerospermopsis sp. SIO1G2]|nr:hypothetical protein [Sphaerospermopsis sp. SIO1G2]